MAHPDPNPPYVVCTVPTIGLFVRRRRNPSLTPIHSIDSGPRVNLRYDSTVRVDAATLRAAHLVLGPLETGPSGIGSLIKGRNT